MTDHSKIPEPGHGDDAASGEDFDIDLDFDLEDLASAPPVSAPAFQEMATEPEVVVFSRGNVLDLAAPALPPEEPPPSPSAEESPAGSASDTDEIPLIFVEEPNGIVAVPPLEVVADHALPPRREMTGKKESPAPAKPLSEVPSDPPLEGGEDLAPVEPEQVESPVLPRSFGEKLPMTKLPPRRKGIPPVSEMEESPAVPEDRAEVPEEMITGDANLGPAFEESPLSLPAVDSAPIPAEDSSKELWSGRVLPEVGAPLAANQRRAPKGLGARVKALPLRWLVIGGAGCVLLIALGSMLGGRGKDDEETTEGAAVGSPPKKGSEPLPALAPPEPLDQTAVLNAIAASTPEARILAQYTELASESAGRYFAATTVEEMLAVVRDPGRVEPLMREFYSRNPLRPKEFLDLTLAPGDDAMIGSKVFWRAKVHLKNEGRGFLVFEQLKAGSRKAFLVDWETTVKYNPMRWDAFATECPAEPMEMRVFCTLSTDYRAPFGDESKYAAFLLTHSDGASEVHAYAARDSEVGRRLLAIAEDDFEVRVYLKLRFAPGSKESVEILEMVDSEDWIVTR